MGNEKYSLSLNGDEEKVAQLLTRDAWNYFGSMISTRELFHVKDIPMMPRRGSFQLSPDEELVQYYLDYAGAYGQELGLYGWDEARVAEAADTFAAKLENISGQLRGRSREAIARQVG